MHRFANCDFIFNTQIVITQNKQDTAVALDLPKDILEPRETLHLIDNVARDRNEIAVEFIHQRYDSFVKLPRNAAGKMQVGNVRYGDAV